MKLPVTIQAKKLAHPSSKVSVYYPVVVQLENHAAQLKINKTIIDNLNKILVDQGYYNPFLQELLAYYEVKTNERDILSLNLIVYSYTGGAHGNTIVKSFTFDVTNGHEYQLNELFKKDSQYVTVLSNIIKKRIEDWGIVLLEPFTQIRQDQDFYLADHSIVIYFQLYEISPYSSGFPYFPIPNLDLTEIIQPNGPLDILLPFV